MSKVSIVIPTLNRAQLLRSALKSALDQQYEDLEIVVSDDESNDDTEAVARSFGDPRVVYVRTGERLNMPDSFEFALKQATGTYLTFLTDDSYLMPDCISTAMDAMQKHGVDLVVWRHCGYFDPEWIEPERRNTLYMPKVTYGATELNSAESLARWFRGIRTVSAEMPRAINSLCHRSLVEKILARQKRFFLSPAPDHSSGAAMLLNTERYLLIDEPLVIDGVAPASIGPSNSFKLGESSDNFYKGFKKKMEDITFLGIPTTPAVIIRSFENVRAFYPGCPEIDVENITTELADSLAKLEVYGSNVDQYWRVLESWVAQQPLRVRLALERARRLLKLRWRAVKAVRASPRLSWLERLRRLDVLRGSEWSFHNIEECAAIVHRRNQAARQEV